MRTRLASLTGWDGVASGVMSAEPQAVAALRGAIEGRAKEALAVVDPASLARIEKAGKVALPSMAEAADADYLDALDAADGNSDHDTVVRTFTRARALAALVYCQVSLPGNTIEAVYELASALPDRTRHELRTVVGAIIK